MTRFPDWRFRFDAYITSRMRMPFAWGANDCALFAADCVREIAGVDLAMGLRSHRTATQAARVIRRHGGLSQIAARALGPSCAPGDAVQGDVLLVQQDGRDLLAVCLGAEHAAAPSAQGLLMIPRALASHAWRVG